MSTTYIEIDEQAWRKQFQPHTDPQGTAGFQAYGYQTEAERRLLEQANAERRLWTYCMTGVGNPYIVQGFAYVNREFYIVCDVPVPDDTEYLVSSDDDWLFCESCGHWFRDESDDDDAVERSQEDDSMCVGCLKEEDDE